MRKPTKPTQIKVIAGWWNNLIIMLQSLHCLKQWWMKQSTPVLFGWTFQ